MIRIADIENGTIRGLPAADPRVTAFKGIPFAAPPVGENRWRAPQPCADWDGVRDATGFAPISVQDTPGLGTDIYCREWHVDSKIPMSEDCLYLNVWTNARSTEDKLPVLVWFFGGALQWGYTAEMEFDGERIARRGVVVVSVNYRLAALGFLAHPEITAQQPDAPGNFGNLDQQAGLKWTKRNIAAFGGDPENITIAGQSAGGFSVMSQITCTDNLGLFEKAVVMSGMFRSPYGKDPLFTPDSLSEAEKKGSDFFAFMGVSSLAEARKLDALTIRDKYAEYVKAHPLFMTIIDGKFCTGDPLKVFLENRGVRVSIMSGNTSDEFWAAIPAESEQELAQRAQTIFGDDAPRFLAFEEAHLKQEEGYAPVSIIENAVKAAFLAEQKSDSPQPCYYYRFSPEIPGDDHPGAFHSVDLWFFFETLSKCTRPFRGKHYDLSRLMCNYWTNFIKTGDPNGKDDDGSEMPNWAPYSADRRAEMVFCDDGAVPSVENSEFKQFLTEHLNKKIIVED
jgi:para-nitrobenzyl esterase